MPNGYFQLFQNESGTYLRLVKATEEGENSKINEIMEYLNTQGIYYDLATLNQGIGMAAQSAEKEMYIPLNPQFFRPVNETYKLWVNPDKMSVFARFYAPSVGGQRMSAAEFYRDLQYQNIVCGIKNAIIDEHFVNPQFGTDIMIAEGIAPRHGSDASIEYYFSTDLSVKPTLNEDGSVDFFNLNNINHCNKDQMLAKLIPEDSGEVGHNVFNEPIKPRDVRKIQLKPTNNVYLSDDKLAMFSSVDGHVMLVEGKVFVSNVYTVENVNSATGNIEFEGSVVVLGNVFSNYSVKAKGNVEIKGVVEGAFIESEGDIIVACGMKGMGKGTLKATGNIIAQFLENAKVEAGGYVSTDSILHSEVVAGSEVNVTSKKGFITGGKVCAGNQVQVKTLGSEMGSNTVVEVGVDPTMKIRIQKLQKRIAELNKDIKAAQPILNSMAQKIAQGVRLQPDQIKYVQNLTIENKQKAEELEASMAELEELQKIFELSGGAQIIVTGEVYVGTQICIGDVSMTVKSSMSYCRFVKHQGEVKMKAI